MGIDESDIEDALELINDAQSNLQDAICKLKEAEKIMNDKEAANSIKSLQDFVNNLEFGWWLNDIESKLNKTTKK